MHAQALSLSPDALHELRMRKLQKQIAYCWERSPLYRASLQAAGAQPGDIREWSDFRCLPVLMNKQIERESQEESQAKLGHPLGMHLCADPADVACICGTSGSTGQPTFTYLYTREDLKDVRMLWGRMLAWMGMKPGERVLHGFGMSMWAMGAPLTSALLDNGYNLIPAGAEAGAERMLKFAELFRPRLLMGTPSLVEHLIERAPQVLGKPVSELGIERIYCSGEPGASIPAVRKRVQDAYGAQLFDGMGGGWARAAISCAGEHSHGLHELTPDYMIWGDDLVDPQTHAPMEVTEGAIGKVLTTALEHRARPVLKYDTGDVAQVYTARCECGFEGRRVRIIGRADDMVIVRGVNVYPAAVRSVVASFVPRCTGMMRIVLKEPPPRAASPLDIKVEHDAALGEGELIALKEELATEIRSRLRFTANVLLVKPGELKVTDKGKSPLVERAY
ncbi:phenylacetate--CoA ligase family protein [Variovorax sp. PBL-E5]|uniref:phenylacetate--CoA ligase family protein n=1 Tax=Variovorax sp. PBL-E5 TaxID=434014 RepID=UPI001316AC3B|nr:AMP-binding protein [Variovorax sp. PBL-E5]VTU46000.1 Phenylacetate-coenzyme A ligase [Variovorax sp. PBL-E5]